MNKENILNYYLLDIILTLYFDNLEENTYLENIIDLKNIFYINNDEIKEEVIEIEKDYKNIINYIIKNKILENCFIDKIFDFHNNSKCIIIQNELIKNKIFLLSVTKYNQHFFKNLLLNKNRLKFLPINLECINQPNCKIYHGIYDELFKKEFFKNIKQYILNLDKSVNIQLIGKSINGMTNIVLGYLISMLIENKINIYSYSICKFCNQDFIDELEKKQNIELNIINHKYDAIQLLIKPFTLNFKKLIIVDKNNIMIQTNRNENQDTIINKHFIYHLFSYSLKYHSSVHFFNDLLIHSLNYENKNAQIEI
jgi:hypothetical protein